MKATASGEAHSAGPFSSAISQPEPSTTKVVGRPTTWPDFCSTCSSLPVGIGVIGQVPDPVLLQPGLRLVAVAGVHVDGDHLEIGTAQLRLELVEGRHLLAAGHAPGRPEIDQDCLALEIGKAQGLPLRAGEGDDRRRLGSAAHADGRHLALGQRLQPLGRRLRGAALGRSGGHGIMRRKAVPGSAGTEEGNGGQAGQPGFSGFGSVRHRPSCGAFSAKPQARLPERPAGSLHESVDPASAQDRFCLQPRASSGAEKPGPLFRTMRYGAATFRSV